LSKEITGAQALMRALEAQGVQHMFGIPGGAILPAYDPLIDSSIHHILARHEQGAAHAADGYAQASGKVGVCMATSGPGATNLVTGLASSYMDSVPVVAVTGQVPRWLIGSDGFQETDATGITVPVTKHNWLVMDPGDIAQTLAEAFHIASTGPVRCWWTSPRTSCRRSSPTTTPARSTCPATSPRPSPTCARSRRRPA
jgi:acetolactate synthase-1/2/3 large subunit